jgi:hypothetical protein
MFVRRFACQGWSIPFKGNEFAELNIIRCSTFDCMLSACLRNNLMCLWGHFLTNWKNIDLWKEHCAMDVVLKIKLFQINIQTPWTGASILPSHCTNKWSVLGSGRFFSGYIGECQRVTEGGKAPVIIRWYSGNTGFDSWLADRPTCILLIILSTATRHYLAGKETTSPWTSSLWHRQVCTVINTFQLASFSKGASLFNGTLRSTRIEYLANTNLGFCFAIKCGVPFESSNSNGT